MNLTSRITVILSAVFLVIISNSNGRDYWQQEVNYRMDVELSEDLRTISGTAEIEYINNSPDALGVLYLKAYPNATQKDSYSDMKRRDRNDYSLADLKPEQEGSLALTGLMADGVEIGFEMDNSIISVRLQNELAPGDTVLLTASFVTVLPKPANMRMGVEKGVTKAVYWYPQVCVYDWKMGWVNSQYVGWGECYGDYGSFEANITAPADQIVAATGACMNEDEVLPESLRHQLDISNFVKARDEWPRLDFGEDKKTWHWVAENVNDFTFTASSEFCLDTGSVGEVEVVAYVLRGNARKWENAVQYGEEAIETYSELFYPYQWPAIRICDAYSGMEYPGLTNCGWWKSEKRFRLLVYHEIAHQWFMGHIGFNQPDRPFLDEGFTTHAEHIAMEKYLGRLGNMDNFQGWYQKTFAPPTEDRNVRGFLPLMKMLESGYDKPMVFSFDRGEEYYPYRVSAYYKGAAMHYSLRSILGDSLYFNAMRQFCDLWLFGHPYEEDLTRSLEGSTGIIFSEYLDQWYYSRDRLDYAFDGRKSTDDGQFYTHTIKIKREGDMVSPVDVAVIWPQGDTALYTIPPEGMEIAKPGAILLPVWNQFRRGEKEYEFVVKARRDIDRVVVDPFNMLPDVNPLNNSSGFLPPIELRFDNMKYDHKPLHKYALRWRPDLFYDEINGAQVGIHSHGSFLGVRNKLDIDARMGTESWRPTIDAIYSSPSSLLGKNSTSSFRILRSDRRTYFSSGYEKLFKDHYSRPDHEYLRLGLSMLNVGGSQETRLDQFPLDVARYLPEPSWDATATSFIKVEDGWVKSFRYGQYAFDNTELAGAYEQGDVYGGFLESRFSFDLDLTSDKREYLSLRLALFHVMGEPPTHFLKHISRAPAYEGFIDAPVFRNPGTFPVEWADDFYVAAPGVRGYQDRSIFAIGSRDFSLSVTPPDMLPYRWLKHIPMLGHVLGSADQSFFVDVSQISFDEKEAYYADWVTGDGTLASEGEWTTYASAGVSVLLPPMWTNHTLRIDFPLYLNKPLPGEDELEFRLSVAWLVD